MRRVLREVPRLAIFLLIGMVTVKASAQPAGDSANPAATAKAAFDKAFTEYKDAIRQIEQLRIDYQTADAATRAKINNDLSGHAAHAQSLLNVMVDAAVEAYRLAPNADKQIADLLVAVAKHHVVGQQSGPAEPPAAADQFIPIDGGDQYERALPIIKLLIDGGTQNRNLYAWGFLAAFITNDYDLAEQYLNQAEELGAMATMSSLAQQQADGQGAEKTTADAILNYAPKLDEYRRLWAKESQIRAAEAAAGDLPRVKLTTTKGEITIELFENDAPQSVANFITLVKQGFYDGSPFHRVLPKFMTQGGAKTDTGGGGPGYTIRCECYKPDYRHHFRGTLSMAHRGRDTGSSQFFLTFVPTTHLDGRHTAFGRVIDGIEVLGDIQRRESNLQSSPPRADRIIKAEVLRDRGHEYKFDKLPE